MLNFFSNRESQVFGIASCVLFAGIAIFIAMIFEARFWNELIVFFPGFVKFKPLMWFTQIIYIISAAALGIVATLTLSWIGKFICAIIETAGGIILIIHLRKRKKEKTDEVVA